MKMSIIIPMYNVENYIEDCLKSIFKQKKCDYEVILVDDGSTDNTVKNARCIIESEEKKNIVTLIEKKNSGASDSRNVGIDHAKGDFIVFMDSDDVMTDNALEIFDQYSNDESADLFVFSLYKKKDEIIESSRLSKISNFKIEGVNSIQALEEYFDKTDYIITWQPWAKMFKTSIIKSNRIRFDEKLYCCNDFNFFFKYFLCIRNIVYVNKPVVVYTVERSGSITTTKALKRIQSSMKAYTEFFCDIYNIDQEANEILDYASYLYLCSLELSSEINDSDLVKIQSEIENNRIIYNYSKRKLSKFKRSCYNKFGLKKGALIIAFVRRISELLPNRKKFSEM